MKTCPAALFGGYLLNRWGLRVPSMQSIWYGRTGSIFDPAQAEDLLAYTGQAFAFAHALNCPSLVFGCPKNRFLPEGADPAARPPMSFLTRRAAWLRATACAWRLKRTRRATRTS